MHEENPTSGFVARASFATRARGNSPPGAARDQVLWIDYFSKYGSNIHPRTRPPNIGALCAALLSPFSLLFNSKTVRASRVSPLPPLCCYSCYSINIFTYMRFPRLRESNLRKLDFQKVSIIFLKYSCMQIHVHVLGERSFPLF